MGPGAGLPSAGTGDPAARYSVWTFSFPPRDNSIEFVLVGGLAAASGGLWLVADSRAMEGLKESGCNMQKQKKKKKAQMR
jgi:hypothetical protein